MDLFQNITVTEVEELYTVRFPKDRIVRMQDRPSFGLSFCASGQLTYTMGSLQVLSDPEHAILLPKGGNYRIHGDKEGIFPVINFHCTGLPCDRIVSIPLNNPQSCLRDCEALQHLLRLGGSRMQIFSTSARNIWIVDCSSTSIPKQNSSFGSDCNCSARFLISISSDPCEWMRVIGEGLM